MKTTTPLQLDEAREILSIVACDSQPAIEVKARSVPEELSTTEAAGIMGISRPTLTYEEDS